MKRIVLEAITLTTGVLLCSVSFGQAVNDSIEMLPGYTNESYYQMSSGEVANVDNTSWDICFDLSGFGATIRTNEHTGTELFVYPNGNITDWASVDTTGISEWNSLHNGVEKWYQGALNATANPGNPFDLGWGIYNMTTHHITGDSIFIIHLANGDYKKLIIDNLASGVYNFTYANIDGTNEVMASLTKADYTDKNFAYYSLVNDAALDREPTNTDWDIVFTKYIEEVAPGAHYGVTGVLSNNGVHVREAASTPVGSAIYSNFTVDSVINVIGYDWKTFNMGTFSYDIEPDLSYFVQDQSHDIWHLIFTRFDGSATGKVVFSKELVASTAGLEVPEIESFGVYPNPAKEEVNIIYNTQETSIVEIISMNGTIVAQQTFDATGFNVKKMAVDHLQSGVYFVKLSSAGAYAIKRLVVE